MPKLGHLEELAAAIRLAATDAEPKVPSFHIAKEFCHANGELIQPVIAQWAIEKLASLLGKHRAKARRESIPQLVFEAGSRI